MQKHREIARGTPKKEGTAGNFAVKLHSVPPDVSSRFPENSYLSTMKFLGNILWLLLGGLVVSLYYAAVGLLYCISIIGIPFGLQLFKMAGLALWPFGHDVQPDVNDGGCLAILMNVIWILCGGIEIALLHVGFGVFCCLTIVGIPFGIQHFKMALLALVPFGKKIS